jgi:adenylate cyclase
MIGAWPSPASERSVSEAGRYTSDEVAELAGIPLEQAKRLWRALGFPETADEAAFDDADVAALRSIGDLLISGVIDFDLAVNLTRGLGLSMARLADWQISALLQRPEGTIDTADELAEPFEEMLVYVWRRHMRASIARVEAARADAEGHGTTELSVGFADIVSFTALSNTLTEDKIGDLVEIFESRCADVVAVQRGRIIKSLGDSVLFVNDDPIRAYDTAEGIINVIGRDPRMPDVRVGLATGSVVTRLGDVFGPPVNMAARLTAVARRNRIIVDDATAALLPSDQFETRRLPARPVRGFGIVEPVSVRRP